MSAGAPAPEIEDRFSSYSLYCENIFAVLDDVLEAQEEKNKEIIKTLKGLIAKTEGGEINTGLKEVLEIVKKQEKEVEKILTRLS